MERVPHHPGRKPRFTRHSRANALVVAGTTDLTCRTAREVTPRSPTAGQSAFDLGGAEEEMGLRLKKSRLCPRTRGRAGPAAAQVFQQSVREIETGWVFVDETWFNTQMSRYWDGEKGERIPEAIPAGRWRSFTLLGALSSSGCWLQ